MNWLDMILIIINVIVIVGGLGLIKDATKNAWYFTEGLITSLGVISIVCIILVFTLFLPFLAIDKSNGSTIGVITSVDADFWDNTYIYIKTSEATQEKYCTENDAISNQAKKLIGKKVKISYGTRVGFYSTGKCKQAPVEQIDEVLESSDNQ